MSDLDYIARISCCIGIDISNFPWNGTLRKSTFTYRFCNICFPLLLHLNAVFTFYNKIDEWNVKILFHYGTVLDMMMIIIPCCLLWATFCSRKSIQTLMHKMMCFRDRNRHIKNCLKSLIIFGLVYWLFFLSLQAFTGASKMQTSENSKKSNNNLQSPRNLSDIALNNSYNRVGNFTFDAGAFFEELIMFIQQLLFPFLFSILFFTLCYNIVQFFKHYQIRFNLQLAAYNEDSMRPLLRDYLELLECVDLFSDTFSNPLLIFTLQILSYMSLMVLDVLQIPKMDLFEQLHMILVTFTITSLAAILTFFAGEIPLRAVSIKKSLSNLKGHRLLKDFSIKDMETIDTILGREVAHITVCNVASFDRSFLFKSVTAIIAHAVIYHTLVQETKISAKL